jgi:hypothetical protein
VSAQLAALQASGGATAAQLAQVQADVDAAAGTLTTDNQATADAITANTIPAVPAAPAPAPAPAPAAAPAAPAASGLTTDAPPAS